MLELLTARAVPGKNTGWVAASRDRVAGFQLHHRDCRDRRAGDIHRHRGDLQCDLRPAIPSQAPRTGPQQDSRVRPKTRGRSAQHVTAPGPGRRAGARGGPTGPPVMPPGPPVTQCQDMAATYFACSGPLAPTCRRGQGTAAAAMHGWRTSSAASGRASSRPIRPSRRTTLPRTGRGSGWMATPALARPGCCTCRQAASGAGPRLVRERWPPAVRHQ
jgi:hypothetical protein